MSDIVLSKGIRSNLLNLQKTADLTQMTQNRLATGKKVNTALDNPTNFFTSASLTSRASDLSALLDGISNGIQTIEAADNGLTSITKVIESMQSTVRQARQDKSWESTSYTLPTGGLTSATTIQFDGGSLTGAVSVTLDPSGSQDLDGDGALSNDEIVTALEADPALDGKLAFSADSSKLRIKNLSITQLTVTGVDSSGLIDGGSATDTIDGNDTRGNLVSQFNDLRDQLDKISEDAQFNGVNLLQGDLLTLYFNETGSSTIDIQSVDKNGAPQAINSTNLGIERATGSEFEVDGSLDTRLTGLKAALNQIQAQSSTFGSNLSVVENRQQFTKAMINTLTTGADNLTLADQNEEAANLLALQTRQQLSQTALSLANQADQGVLRLFG
jgi:flagellin-like hook-associated protein FlgL